MIASDAASAAATWRPQLFGDRRAASIPDPIIEPLWTGPRVLAFVDARTARLTDAQGQPIEDQAEVLESLRASTAGATVLLDGFLTPEPIQATEAIAARDLITIPKPGQAMAQFLIGTRGGRKDRHLRQQEEVRQRTMEGLDDRLALVAVDLLWLDDESLCDVPLLERKRILEAVVPESELVRVGIHVRPPIDAWLGSWRSFGFQRLAYKSANSRYVPGQKNHDWATAAIPAR